jgi:hypothetical protein
MRNVRSTNLGTAATALKWPPHFLWIRMRSKFSRRHVVLDAAEGAPRFQSAAMKSHVAALSK